MAGIPGLTDLQKSDKYQKALSLNLDCGSDILRTMIESELDSKGLTFKKYLKDQSVQNKISELKRRKILFKEQINLLNNKTPDFMDISLLTLILLELFPTTQSQKTNLKKLRTKRNQLAHRPKAMLEDDLLFIEASQIILALAKEISGDYENDIGKKIENLKCRELVRTRCSMDMIVINGEALMMKLVDSGKNERVDGNDETWIKLGLTKYVIQLSRFLDIDVLLQHLEGNGVDIAKIRSRIENIYNHEEQMQQFVLHMMTADKETLLKLCSCLRKTNSLLADLVQHKTSIEKDLAEKLQAAERARLHDILKMSLIEEGTSSIACEDIHIFCEEKGKHTVNFSIVQKCVVECFPDVNFEEKDSRFHGITWKDGEPFLDNSKENEDREVISDMPCDIFGEYLAAKMEKVKQGIGIYFERSALEECISAEIFSSLSDDQLSQVFSGKLKDAGHSFGFGIKLTLSEIQKTIKRQTRRPLVERKCVLRKFDSAADDIIYTKGIVESSPGNLLTAAHLFVCPENEKHGHFVRIIKEVMRFALACINGKKNGTIHFGIKEVGNGNGEIVGLPKEDFKNIKALDDAIISGIKISFDQKYQSIAQRCIRPVQNIPVEDELIVLEIDIVPFSGYIGKDCLQIKYPPKGFQRQKCFVFKDNRIHTIEESKIDSMQKDFENLLQERVYLEMKAVNSSSDAKNIENKRKLTKLLTGGNKYVTDAFTPIICSGEISGCPNEDFLRERISKMAVAFTSALAVLDFDSSVDLRNSVEKGNTFFQVKMAEEFSTRRVRQESGVIESNIPVWIYSNGNEEIDKRRMTSEMWYGTRLPGLKTALQQMRQQIPTGRGIFIHLVFQKPIDCDLLLELARETFLSSFKDECIVITDNDAILQEWRKEMKGKMSTDNFDRKIVTGLSWEEVATTVKEVFKPNKDVLFKFPDSTGQAVEMTSKELEEMKFNDIELVDGFAEDQCSLEEEDDTDENCRRKRTERQENFYKGNPVTKWNFYYSTQVATRDVFKYHKDEIEYKILSKGGKDRFAFHNIEHNPGAGGSTVAKHLLWELSQIGRQPEKAYRCCIVQKITEDTAEEIYRFQQFKEKHLSDAKPVIALVDNKSEEHVTLLKLRVDEIAYKKGSPGNLFCLLLIVTRVPVSVSHVSRNMVIQHNLTKREQMWFDKKSKELESNADMKIKTLIAFNVMRHSFDYKYIKDTTQKLIEDTNSKEQQVLGYLSVICSFDSDNPVPESIFDSVMSDSLYDPDKLTLQQCINRPFGIVWSEKERRKLQAVDRETWNISITGAMQLLITHREINSGTRPFMGVCILSQPLAKAILEYIMVNSKKTFCDMVINLLEVMEYHASEKNAMSRHFVKIICSLFTLRESFTDDKGERKLKKFSPLILRLETQEEKDTLENAQKRVTGVLRRCFQACGNAMVGQQLARYYYIMTKDYSSAENTITQCLQQLPRNTYLLDTYGQIFKTKMEQLFSNLNGKKMINCDAVECVNLAFKAVEKFKLAQDASTQQEGSTEFNANSFYMEVMTALSLLEHVHKFECYIDKDSFWKFLNDEDFCLDSSPYKEIVELAPSFETFRKGRETQHHLEKSLRTLEERAYMTRNLTTVFTPSGDTLLLKPREKFEMFYGSKEHTSQFEFLFGIGLKLLMKAHKNEESRVKLGKRVKDAERRLEQKESTEEERDLLVFLGYNIIKLSTQQTNSSLILYRNMLNYSTLLWKIQKNKHSNDRQYVEAYLYYALLHWIITTRTELGIEGLSHPETYNVLLKNWEDVYMVNNHIRSREQLRKEKPKIYFAIGKGYPGNDIVDLEWLRHLWREEMQKQGRTRKEVRADDHWNHPIFESHLKRLSGTVDSTGRRISTEVTYNKRNYTFNIKTLEYYEKLTNRAVTFVLAFSWMSPVALDVRKHEKSFKRQASQRSPENTQDNLFQNSCTHDRVPCEVASTNYLENIPDNQRSRFKDEQRSLNGTSNPETCLDNMHSSMCNILEGQPKKTVYSRPKSQDAATGQNKIGITIDKNTSKGSETKAVGPGRGRGRGNISRQEVEFMGARPKTKDTHKTGKEVIQVISDRRQVPKNVTAEKKPSHLFTNENEKFKTKQDPMARIQKDQTDLKDNSGSLSNVPNQSVDGSPDDGWTTVSSKKRSRGVRKEEQSATNRSRVAPMGSSYSNPKQQKFEELVKKCEQKYTRSSRSELITAYNTMKDINGGSLEGLSMEIIIEEIGYYLRH